MCTQKRGYKDQERSPSISKRYPVFFMTSSTRTGFNRLGSIKKTKHATMKMPMRTNNPRIAKNTRNVFIEFDPIHSAGDGNRTHTKSLGSSYSTIELHPHLLERNCILSDFTRRSMRPYKRITFKKTILSKRHDV